MGGDMIGLAALDLVLRQLGAGTMNVALVVEVACMNPNDCAADATGFRVPLDPISNFELFSHESFPMKDACWSFPSEREAPIYNA